MFRHHLARLRHHARILGYASGATVGVYTFIVGAKMFPTHRLTFTSTSQNPPEFMESPSCALANPRKHKPFTETIYTTVDVPPGSPLERLSDEEILARVLKGYLAGWAIAPERWALWCAGADNARFEEVPNPGPKIWYPWCFSDTALPPLHSRPIGGFLILDKHVEDSTMPRLESHSPTGWTTRSSYIDLGFGFNKPGSDFCGVDRFAVTREIIVDDGEDRGSEERRTGMRLRLSYQAMACNPSEYRLPLTRVVLGFHSVYAKVLFREGVARLLKSVK